MTRNLKLDANHRMAGVTEVVIVRRVHKLAKQTAKTVDRTSKHIDAIEERFDGIEHEDGIREKGVIERVGEGENRIPNLEEWPWQEIRKK